MRIDLRSRRTQQILGGVVLLGIGTYVFFISSWLPICYQVRRHRTAELRQEYQRLETELNQAKQMVDQLSRLEREYLELTAKTAIMDRLLPSENAMPELLRQITLTGERAGVEFLLFEPAGEIQGDRYVEHPIRVRVSGGYHSLGLFLSHIANLSRLVNVRELKLESLPNEEDESETVRAQMILTAYTASSEQPVAQKEDKNKRSRKKKSKQTGQDSPDAMRS